MNRQLRILPAIMLATIGLCVSGCASINGFSSQADLGNNQLNNDGSGSVSGDLGTQQSAGIAAARSPTNFGNNPLNEGGRERISSNVGPPQSTKLATNRPLTGFEDIGLNGDRERIFNGSRSQETSGVTVFRF